MKHAWLAWLFALVCASGWAQTPPTHQHGFGGAEHWAHIFDDPARDAWQKPHEVIAALALSQNATVADIGAGTGYFSARLANMLPQGRVFAVDLEPDMVRYLKERAQREKLPNLEPVQAAADDPRLPAPVDCALLVDTYHHIGARVDYFRRLRDKLKPGGSVAIIDFRPDAPMGPPKSARIAAPQVIDEMQRAGYTLAREHAFLPHQYFLVFRPR